MPQFNSRGGYLHTFSKEVHFKKLKLPENVTKQGLIFLGKNNLDSIKKLVLICGHLLLTSPSELHLLKEHGGGF